MDTETLLAGLGDSHRIDLEQPRRYGAPIFPAHAPGYVYTLHRRHEPGLGARTSASGTITMAEHSGTHIDALCHQAEVSDGQPRMYGGRPVDSTVQTPAGFTALGAETIPPIFARGVLLDVARHLGVSRLEPGHAVSARELAGAAEEQGTPAAGDVVLVRTGNGALWDDPDAYGKGPGIGADASSWLAAREPLAVGTDNLAWDLPGMVAPETETTLPGHLILLVRAGIYIIENVALEILAAALADSAGPAGGPQPTFGFCCLPLKLCGATGSPVHPLAILPTGQGD